MHVSAALLAALTVAAVATVPAEAAKKKPRPKPVPKSCNLVTDGTGDAKWNNTPGDDSVDVVGGDFASNGKQLTGVIKVKALQQSNPSAPFGQAYFVLFSVRGAAEVLTLSAGLYPTGNQFTYGYQGDDPATGVPTSYTLGNATGVVSGNEIRVTANVADFPQKTHLRNGNQVVSLEVEARRVWGQRVVPSQQAGPVRVPLGGVTTTYDDATGKKYTLGAPSCVPIGR